MNIDKELEKIFNDPLLEVSDKEMALFDIPKDMKEVMKKKKPDYTAQRKACEDFDLYRERFEEVHRDLKTGRRQLKRIGKTDSLQRGRFFIVDGQLLLLAEIGELSKSANGMPDARTRCIMENGTETDILLQTLRKSVVGNGYGVTDIWKDDDTVFSRPEDVKTGDMVTGYIYVLRSLSDNAAIRNTKNLYKIGFSTNEVEKRIENAANEPTYLMAPVEIVCSYKIVNMNSHKFETILHQVLQSVNFHITVTDNNGVEHQATEWYVVPLNMIEAIIGKITDGTITQYSYDKEHGCLVYHEVKQKPQFDTTGMKVLTLNIKQVYLDQIVSGKKTKEYRDIKQSMLNRYTFLDKEDGKRYLRRYDALRLYAGYHRDRDSALVEIKDTTYEDGQVVYHLGKVLFSIKH